jgi:hypothetical protein
MVQSASKKYTGDWLSMYQCKLVAKAILSLKSFEETWSDSTELLQQRVSYFFSDAFTKNKNYVVFLTFPLFVRDILENREINSYIHDPVVFMTISLSHFLFKEYPVHMYIDANALRAENGGIKLMEIGGLFISDGENVSVNSCISKIISTDAESAPQLKAAATNLGEGIFKIDEHERKIMPDTEVWDKYKRVVARIFTVEPGETGEVGIRYDDGNETMISKLYFDNHFVCI